MTVVADMFTDCQTPAERGERFEDYKAKLTGAIQRQEAGKDRWAGKGAIAKGVGAAGSLADHVATITKSLSPESAASLASELEAVKSATADLQKDWTFAGPSGVQLVPYDLEAPAKLLVPRMTPLRNEISRTKGVGTGRQYKRILGFTNAGVGGVPDLSPFMNSETVQTSFGSLALRRGQKIAYSADQQTVPYEEMSFSDQVNTKAYFTSLGFEDVRQLSQTALLWAHLLGEEKAMLYGRGTASPYAGTAGAPTVSTVVAGGTGGTIPAATYFVKVTTKAGFGESVVSNEVAGTAVTLGQKLTITLTEPAGSTGVYNVYASTSTGTETFQGTFSGNVIVLSSYVTGGAAMPGADTSGDPNAFDGLLTSALNPANGGTITRVNGALNATPGADFQNTFLAMWNLVYADPDEIWTTASVRNELGNQLIASGSSNYRITLTDSGGGKVLGQMVAGIVNHASPEGKMLDLRVHPYMPAGTAFVRSKTLPIPDSEVGETTQMVMVQDYMSVDWTQIQFTFDQSTYTLGTMVNYAPKWNGILTGIQ
jgi:hypothetical protein